MDNDNQLLYVDGYEACLQSFRRTLNESIVRNNGAKTPSTITNVLNDIIAWSYDERAIIEDMRMGIEEGVGIEEQSQPEPQSLSGINIYVVRNKKGGN